MKVKVTAAFTPGASVAAAAAFCILLWMLEVLKELHVTRIKKPAVQQQLDHLPGSTWMREIVACGAALLYLRRRRPRRRMWVHGILQGHDQHGEGAAAGWREVPAVLQA
ncbi:Hypothetical predicted protein [Scomber scombrus]|uniref:Uncharacterized protein n=1 Tax=Scomber scombrus TaxID=13677 RepID=A0AAV1QJ74_SCOSC